MTRSILIVDSFYTALSASLGLDVPLPDDRGAESALQQAMDFGFGTGGALLTAFREAGWHAELSYANVLALQDGWARDAGVRRPIRSGWQYGPHLGRLPVISAALPVLPHLHRVLLDQVERLRPDVVYIQDMNLVPPSVGRALHAHSKLVVGEIASPLPPLRFLRHYDLIVSALPSIVQTARSLGLSSEYVPLGFDARWARAARWAERDIDAIFVGSFSRLQPRTAPLLRAIGAVVPGLQVYGAADPAVITQSGLESFYRGPAWGYEMFELLGRSKVAVNRHGDIAGDFAVNMRMFEATGSGAALVTEAKSNLGELFEVGEEVLAYESFEQAAQLAAEVLADPRRLDRIAAAGQRRTLRDHTYGHRAQELSELMTARLDARASP